MKPEFVIFMGFIVISVAISVTGMLIASAIESTKEKKKDEI